MSQRSSEWSLDAFGDRAWRVVVRDHDALTANAHVHRLAASLKHAAPAGVLDVVPGMRDVVIHVDPLRCDVHAIEAALRDPRVQEAQEHASEPITVPVEYGGAAGPDLGAVADACGLSVEEVCRRHMATTYRVCFLGFQPGFPYLGLLDPALRVARRTAPRPRVPAGSVAVAGEFTGIYPWETPGGWHIIGRTDIVLFDLSRQSPATLQPGDHVRFVQKD